MKSHPPRPFRVRAMRGADRRAIIGLATSLSEFFPTDFIHAIDESLKKQSCLVGFLGTEIVGFLVWTQRDSLTAEITSMGIKEEFHGLGLGTMLLESLEQHVIQNGVTKLIVSTLAYTVDYKPFEKVRAFYYHRGFKSLGIQENYYYEGVDRLILVKSLG